MPSTANAHDVGLLGLRPEGRDDRMQRAHPASEPACELRPSASTSAREGAHHLGHDLADHLDRRPARLLDHRDIEVALLVGLHLGLERSTRARRLEEALDRALGRADARALASLPSRRAAAPAGPARRAPAGAASRTRWRPRRRDPRSTSRSVTSFFRSSAARACMRAGISSENSSSRRSGMAVTGDDRR